MVREPENLKITFVLFTNSICHHHSMKNNKYIWFMISYILKKMIIYTTTNKLFTLPLVNVCIGFLHNSQKLYQTLL